MSYLHYPADYNALHRRAEHMAGLWRRLAQVSAPRPAAVIVGVAVVLFALGFWKGRDVKVGDLHGASRAARRLALQRRQRRHHVEFSISVDILTAIVETKPEGCVDHSVMSTIDGFAWHMENVEGSSRPSPSPRSRRC